MSRALFVVVSILLMAAIRCASAQETRAVADVMVNGQLYEDWGLHLIDANLTMGNLISIVGDETTAYLAHAKK